MTARRKHDGALASGAIRQSRHKHAAGRVSRNEAPTPAQIVVGASHAWQGGHKGFQRLGNASADPNPSGQRNRCGIGFL